MTFWLGWGKSLTFFTVYLRDDIHSSTMKSAVPISCIPYSVISFTVQFHLYPVVQCPSKLLALRSLSRVVSVLRITSFTHCLCATQSLSRAHPAVPVSIYCIIPVPCGLCLMHSLSFRQSLAYVVPVPCIPCLHNACPTHSLS